MSKQDWDSQRCFLCEVLMHLLPGTFGLCLLVLIDSETLPYQTHLYPEMHGIASMVSQVNYSPKMAHSFMQSFNMVVEGYISLKHFLFFSTTCNYQFCFYSALNHSIFLQ